MKKSEMSINSKSIKVWNKLPDDIETLKHLLPQFFNTIQSNLLTECIQDQFLKDCSSKHVGPIVS